MKFKIADGLSLPIEAVTQTFAVLGKRGSGKTFASAVLAEEMLKAGQQVVVIDPTGAWWGLRSSADGKHPGFPVVVFGGDHGDLPLEESSGEILAKAMVEHRFSAVLDLSVLRKAAVRRFAAPFLETLYRLNREAMHLFVDEADALAPQRVMGDEARVLGAMEDIVRRGRRKGIGCTLITQRPQALAKSILTQAECLFAMRLVHPRDIDAIKEWIDVHSSLEESNEVIESLPSLEIGTAWFWSPGWMDVLKKVAIRRRETFDSSATPKPGERQIVPKSLAAVDLKRLGAEIEATIEQSVANDPKELKRRLAAAEATIAKLEKRPATVEKIEVPVISKAMMEEIAEAHEAWKALIAKWVDAIAPIAAALAKVGIRQPEPSGHIVQKRPEVRERCISVDTINRIADRIGNGGKRRILTALAQFRDGMNSRRLSLLTGISASGGTWRTYVADLRGSGFIEGKSDWLHITDEGVAALGAYEELPTGDALRDYWRTRLGDGGKRRIFNVIVGQYPKVISPDQVAALAEIDIGGGTWRTYIAELRGLGLVEGRGDLRAADYLFE